jgi:hypothetical protein
MNRILARLQVIIVIAVLSVPVGWTQGAPTGTVKGSVTGGAGPVAGVRAVIGSASVSSYTANATTDQQGTFTFSDSPVGGIEVKVYDANGNMLVSGKGNLRFQGDVITLALQVP